MKIFRKLLKMNNLTENLTALRINYNERKHVFLEKDIDRKDPIDLFKKWLKIACNTPEIIEPNAMCLSTVNQYGQPSSRYVLLKMVTDEGFTFFTNYGSHKAMEIETNPNVALNFFWGILRRQIRIEGTVRKISHQESVEYFHQRPRASQIAAVASPQSQVIPSREYLDEIEASIKNKLEPDEIVPIPNWGGYLVMPHLVEFWQGQTNRLHDRIRFRKMDNGTADADGVLVHVGENGWIYERLAP